MGGVVWHVCVCVLTASPLARSLAMFLRDSAISALVAEGFSHSDSVLSSRSSRNGINSPFTACRGGEQNIVII